MDDKAKVPIGISAAKEQIPFDYAYGIPRYIAWP